MFVNRLSRNVVFRESISDETAVRDKMGSSTFLPQMTTQDLYQAAAEQAYKDYQLNMLFNAEYYGDHGSGI